VYLFRPASAEGKNPIIHALDRALGYRAEPESREALHELAQRVFGG
jgi:cobaltochelatase CobS